MRGRRGVGFDLLLALIGTGPVAGWAMWHWPWEDEWLGWLGWPVISAFAVCFALARVIGGLYAGWPGLDGPAADAPADDIGGRPDRPMSLAELAALGVGAAALLGLGWAITHPESFMQSIRL